MFPLDKSGREAAVEEKNKSNVLTGESLFELGRGGHVHRALAVTVDQRGIGPVAQQQGTNLHTVLGRCLVQGGELPQVHGVHTRAMLKTHKHMYKYIIRVYKRTFIFKHTCDL